MNKLGSAGRPGSGSFLFADPVDQDRALTEADHAREHQALAALRNYQDEEIVGGNGNGGGHREVESASATHE